MSTVMLMHWPEVSREQYERARKEVNWEGDTPKGAKFHVSWIGGDGFHVLDLWESKEDFQKFVEERLMPGVQKIGIQGQPNVDFADPVSVFAPNV
jgi:heme-degrading monooxygenase HmoA